MVWTQNMTKQALDYWHGEMRWLTQETTKDQGNEVANTHKMTKQGLADWRGEMNNWHQEIGWLTKKTTRIRQLSWEVDGILSMKMTEQGLDDWAGKRKANRRKQHNNEQGLDSWPGKMRRMDLGTKFFGQSRGTLNRKNNKNISRKYH